MAIRTRYNNTVNMKRFFKEYLPLIPFTEASGYKDEEWEEGDGLTMGWMLERNHIVLTIALGKISYKVLDIFQGDNDIWHLSLLTVEKVRGYGRWDSISVDMITPGWVNKYSNEIEFYINELTQYDNGNN